MIRAALSHSPLSDSGLAFLEDQPLPRLLPHTGHALLTARHAGPAPGALSFRDMRSSQGDGNEGEEVQGGGGKSLRHPGSNAQAQQHPLVYSDIDALAQQHPLAYSDSDAQRQVQAGYGDPADQGRQHQHLQQLEQLHRMEQQQLQSLLWHQQQQQQQHQQQMQQAGLAAARQEQLVLRQQLMRAHQNSLALVEAARVAGLPSHATSLGTPPAGLQDRTTPALDDAALPDSGLQAPLTQWQHLHDQTQHPSLLTHQQLLLQEHHQQQQQQTMQQQRQQVQQLLQLRANGAEGDAHNALIESFAKPAAARGTPTPGGSQRKAKRISQSGSSGGTPPVSQAEGLPGLASLLGVPGGMAADGAPWAAAMKAHVQGLAAAQGHSLGVPTRKRTWSGEFLPGFPGDATWALAEPAGSAARQMAGSGGGAKANASASADANANANASASANATANDDANAQILHRLMQHGDPQALWALSTAAGALLNTHQDPTKPIAAAAGGGERERRSGVPVGGGGGGSGRALGGSLEGLVGEDMKGVFGAKARAGAALAQGAKGAPQGRQAGGGAGSAGGVPGLSASLERQWQQLIREVAEAEERGQGGAQAGAALAASRGPSGAQEGEPSAALRGLQGGVPGAPFSASGGGAPGGLQGEDVASGLLTSSWGTQGLLTSSGLGPAAPALSAGAGTGAAAEAARSGGGDGGKGGGGVPGVVEKVPAKGPGLARGTPPGRGASEDARVLALRILNERAARNLQPQSQPQPQPQPQSQSQPQPQPQSQSQSQSQSQPQSQQLQAQSQELPAQLQSAPQYSAQQYELLQQHAQNLQMAGAQGLLGDSGLGSGAGLGLRSSGALLAAHAAGLGLLGTQLSGIPGPTSAFSAPRRANSLVDAVSSGYNDGPSEGAEGPGPEEAAEIHRRLRRMKSNRESARRARQKRQTRLEELELQSAQLREANSRLLRRALDAERRVRRAEDRNQELMKTIAELNGETSTSGPREGGSGSRQRDATQGEERDPQPRVGDSEAGSRRNMDANVNSTDGGGAAEGGCATYAGAGAGMGTIDGAPDAAVAHAATAQGEARPDGPMGNSNMDHGSNERDEGEGGNRSDGSKGERQPALGSLRNYAEDEDEEDGEGGLDGVKGCKQSLDSSQSYSGELLP